MDLLEPRYGSRDGDPVSAASINRTVLADIRLDDLSHDPWGTAFEHAWALCEAFAYREEWEYIPPGLKYSPGIRGPFADPEDDYLTACYLAELDRGHFTPEQGQRALLVLDRYLDVCRRAGRDY